MDRFDPAAARRASLLMVGSALAFSCMSACTSALQGGCDWRLVAAIRAAAALVLAFGLASWRRVPLVVGGPPALWVRGVAGSVSMVCTFYALGNMPIAPAVTLLNAFPLWVAVLSWPVLGRRPTVVTLVAVACGVAGVGLIERPTAGGFAANAASAAALAASGCTAVVMLGLNRLKRLHALAIVVHFSAVATVACTGYALLSPEPLKPVVDPPRVALLLLGVGTFATAGQVLMTKAFALGPPERLAVLGLLQVVFAFGSGQLLGQAAPDGWAFVGVLLVIAPSAWLLRRETPPTVTQRPEDALMTEPV